MGRHTRRAQALRRERGQSLDEWEGPVLGRVGA
jgi:hypothetical protein